MLVWGDVAVRPGDVFIRPQGPVRSCMHSQHTHTHTTAHTTKTRRCTTQTPRSTHTYTHTHVHTRTMHTHTQKRTYPHTYKPLMYTRSTILRCVARRNPPTRWPWWTPVTANRMRTSLWRKLVWIVLCVCVVCGVSLCLCECFQGVLCVLCVCVFLGFPLSVRQVCPSACGSCVFVYISIIYSMCVCVGVCVQ